MFLPLFLNQVLDFISAYFFDVVYVKEMFVIPCEQLKLFTEHYYCWIVDRINLCRSINRNFCLDFFGYK